MNFPRRNKKNVWIFILSGATLYPGRNLSLEYQWVHSDEIPCFHKEMCYHVEITAISISSSVANPVNRSFLESTVIYLQFYTCVSQDLLGYIKWVLLENHCVHYRIFHYNFVSPLWDLKCESQSKNCEYRTLDAQVKKSLVHETCSIKRNHQVAADPDNNNVVIVSRNDLAPRL